MSSFTTSEAICYRIEIVNTIQRNGHTEYVLKIQDPQGVSRLLYKRYREIRELHDNMKVIYPVKLTWFPGKRYFRNFDPKFIDARRKELQHYLNGLILLEPSPKSEVLRRFLKLSAESVTPVVGQPKKPSMEIILQETKDCMIDLALPLPVSLDAASVDHRNRCLLAVLHSPFNLPSSRQTIGTTTDKQHPSQEEPQNTAIPNADISMQPPITVLQVALDSSVYTLSQPPILPRGLLHQTDSYVENIINAPSIGSSGNFEVLQKTLKHISSMFAAKTISAELPQLLASYPPIVEKGSNAG